MQTVQIEISKARQSQLALAFKAGKAAALKNLESKKYEYDFQIPNKFADRDGGMPGNLGMPAVNLQNAQWHAFQSGVLRGYGKISGAATMMRNARFFLCEATRLGRA